VTVSTDPDTETSTDASTSALDAEGLRKEFGELTAVDGVSFTIEQGEFFTLVGPSGCGKTTLLRMLSGLEEPTAGTVHIDGADTTRLPAERRPTSMVFQDLALFPHKDVLGNVCFGLKMQGVARSEREQRGREMLELLGLDGYADNAIEELSGGERQRVALGRSLLTEPDLLLLDEPLASLDVKLRREMQLELRRIHDDLGSTFLYVTHDQQVALTASDRIGVMNDGNLVQVGTPQEVYEEPATPFVAEFIGETNLWAGDHEDGLVATDAGLEIAAGRGETAAEGRVHVSVRPERIDIAADAVEADNAFQGTVADRIYEGDDITYQVAVNGTDLQVEQPAKESRGLFEPGDSVGVGFDRENAYVVTGTDR
jgi:ABC-type Fe3+/spermidine/putrescine transport system ATPase subunit